jgi:hypothetical protein
MTWKVTRFKTCAVVRRKKAIGVGSLGERRPRARWGEDGANSILDEIHAVVAGQSGFTAEGVVLIVSENLNYRLGRDTESAEE